jgi:hypothetical protein
MVCWIARHSSAHQYYVPINEVDWAGKDAQAAEGHEGHYPIWYTPSVLGAGKSHQGAPLWLKLQLGNSRKKLPGVIGLGGFWIVSELFRTLVEEREPGLHQFFPAAILTKSGEPWPHNYFVFNICLRLKASLLEKSKLVWRTRFDGERDASTPGNDDTLFVDREVVRGRHVWRDGFFSDVAMISDELKQALVRRKFKELQYTRVQEI